MKSFRMHGLAVVLGLCALPGEAAAASVEEIVRDTQRLMIEDDKVSMVWWIPLEFWAETVRANPSLANEVRLDIIAKMSDYSVVGLLQARAGAEGLESVQPREELIKNTRFDVGGKSLQPLAVDQVSPTAAALIAQLKPMLTEAVGAVGQATDFVVYPAIIDGKVVVDAGLPGSLNITFYGKKHVWRLPLASLLPPKADKATGEIFPGNYEYNPFTGKKLDSSK